MRMIVFFDLPSVTYVDQKEYNKFSSISKREDV